MKNSLIKSIIKGLDYILTKSEKKRFIIISIALVFSSFFDIIGLFLISNFISLILNEANNQINLFNIIINNLNIENDIYKVVSIIILTLITSTIYRLYILKKLYTYTADLEKRLTLSFVDQILEKEYLWYTKTNSSEINNIAVTEIPNIILQIVNPMLMLFSHLSMGITIFLTIFYLNPQLSIFIILFILTLYVIVSRNVYSIVKHLGVERVENIENKHIFFNDLTLNFKYYKISNNISIFQNLISNILSNLSNVNAKFNFISQSPRIIIESTLYIISSIILMYAIVNGISIFENIGVLSFLIMSAIKILPVFQNIYVIISQFKFGVPSIEKLIKLIDNKLESKKNELSQKKINFDLLNTISLNNIKFNFDENIIFNNLSVVFDCHSINVIKGESGSGKSTLVDILLMLLKPKSGEIRLGNITLNDHYKRNWLENISYVPQNVTFYDETIAQNISLEDNSNQLKIEKLLGIVGLLEKVKSFKEGIYHRLGENGKSFSGGQRQRLAIARALYKDPRILILDEPTSALDEKNEILIMNLIEKISKRTTIFLITHSTNYLPKTSNIYLVKNKTINKI